MTVLPLFAAPEPTDAPEPTPKRRLTVDELHARNRAEAQRIVDAVCDRVGFRRFVWPNAELSAELREAERAYVARTIRERVGAAMARQGGGS